VYSPKFHYFRHSKMRILLFIILFPLLTELHAQADSTIKTSPTDTVIAPKPYKHSPRKATLLSLAFPGAGQIYNKKNWWWKTPIIYGGGAALIYGAVFYQKQYLAFKDAYAYRVATGSDFNNNPRFDRYQTATLYALRNSYQEARDEMFIGMFLLYTLQVMDAAVEAHFFDFNISDDLSLNIQPLIVPNGPMAHTGFQLNINFTKH
jgi:hypothetical protein